MGIIEKTFLVVFVIIFANACSLFHKPKYAAGDLSVNNDPRLSRLFLQARTMEASDPKEAIDIYEQVVKDYPFSRLAHVAQFRIGENYYKLRKGKKAFYAYQKVIDNYPQSPNFKQVIDKQFALANILNNKRGEKKLLIFSPVNSKDVIKMFEQISENGKFSDYAPKSLLEVGLIHKDRGDKKLAIETFRKITDKYPNTKYAGQSQFEIASIIDKEVKKGSKDVKKIKQAKEAYKDYMNLANNNERVSLAREQINRLSFNEVQNNLDIAKFYEKTGKEKSALIYYKEVAKSSFPKLRDEANNRIKKLQN